MDIIISPAKKMNLNTDAFSYDSLPPFMDKTAQLHSYLKNRPFNQLKTIWKCSDKLATFNFQRLHQLNITENLTPALFAYEGIQYQYMAPDIFTDKAIDYVKNHLYILSGFYGILSAFDGIIPYRLEMQAKLIDFEPNSLYSFWSHDLANYIEEKQTQEATGNILINLASDEYSKAVIKHLSSKTQVIHFKFGQVIDGKIKEKGTLVKMARGEMVRYLAENQVHSVSEIKNFKALGFEYNPHFSSANLLVFTLNESS